MKLKNYLRERERNAATMKGGEREIKLTNDDIKHVERLLNERPGKRLGFKKPKEVFSESVALGP
ncbi:MAG: hypothetical protein JXB88_18305 [Spirochaetales bacterium]|nr:hypothetical protein [Spirochaetales bacterium]